MWEKQPVFCLTVDVDWASEEVLGQAHDLLETWGATPTYFLTHPSELLSGLLVREAIDTGIHPNFLPGSSHGEHWQEVINYCLGLVQSPRCFRSHRYYDSPEIAEALYGAGLRYDSNLYSFLQPGLAPQRHTSGLMRLPTFFEDGDYLAKGGGLSLDPSLQQSFSTPGLKIIAVHPLDMALNTPEAAYSRRVKDSLSRQDMRSLGGPQLQGLRHPGRGIRDLVEDILTWIDRSDHPVMSLHQIYQLCLQDH